ncbi:MAG: protein translocase subunit SecF [Alphaproteobacteria bacterium]|nr:MAG: protein translocase subunit SecF [Alphaproteobacteria bacterium]
MLRLISDNTTIKFIKLKTLSFTFSGILSVLAILSVLFVGLNFGIDFKGGILLEVRTGNNITISDIRSKTSDLNIGEVSIQEFGAKSDYLIRVERQKGSDNAQQVAVEILKDALNKAFGKDIDYRRLEYVGPTVSKDLISDGVMAICFAIMAMLAYIWFRFELPFAIGAIVALLHDIILTLGVFSILGLEFNLSTVAAILLIIGYSMNDTVVVYDRIRENLRKFKKMELKELLDKSINETLSRTINTTITTMLALGALYLIGGQIISDFAFAMLWGIIVGTYSSIFIASTILMFLNIRRSKESES